MATWNECPWPDAAFHGVVSWDSLHHNTLEDILTALHVVERCSDFLDVNPFRYTAWGVLAEK